MRLIERDFSDRQECPSVLIANLHVTADIGKNLARMDEVVQVAHEKGANIVIFPELCVTGYVWDEEPESTAVTELLEEGENRRIAQTVKRIRDGLREDGRGLEYVFYNNVRRKDDGFYNSTFVLHRGLDYTREEYIYDKVFLPPLEQRYFRQGLDRRLTIETRWGSFGFLICYDLCFIELARKYAFQDHVDAIVTMAHWRSEAVREYARMNIMTDHYYGFLWDLMNSSKAAYNQVWSLGANAVGPHDVSGSYFWGGSGIWAPSGMGVVQASNITEELILVRNLDIRGQRERERDAFDYRIDFDRFYRQIGDQGTATRRLP
ncbi:MAG: carbon-nitrogen hydrolase family protein [Spirochaetaceae bacterium]|nr:MAG: carbon-nitrogen hydrolase family protein [Spirochaetaceae bacterium]